MCQHTQKLVNKPCMYIIRHETLLLITARLWVWIFLGDQVGNEHETDLIAHVGRCMSEKTFKRKLVEINLHKTTTCLKMQLNSKDHQEEEEPAAKSKKALKKEAKAAEKAAKVQAFC